MTTTLKKKVPLDAFRIGPDALQFELLAADPAQPTVRREWSMVANTGKAMHRWWGSLILDLDGAKFRQKVGLLLDHQTDQRLGYSTEVKRTPRGLEAKGKLLDNEHANLVLGESQQGFPFQASLMAVAARVQVLDDDEEAAVNGQTVKGPVAIFREWTLRELTLTVLGADDETATEAFAANGEIEVTMMKKTTENDPTKESGSLATQDPPSHGAEKATESKAEKKEAAPDGVAAERKRADAILAAADPSQAELAKKLVHDGTELSDALSQLNDDLRKRLGVARQQLREGTEPLGSGNASGGDGGGMRAPAQLRAAMPTEAERKQIWDSSPALREEFTLQGESEELGLKRYLAFGRYAAKYCRGEDPQKLFAPRAEALGATESHLQPLTERGVRGDYYLGLETRDTTWLRDIATVYDTDSPQEIYPFLGVVPQLFKWEGDRKVQTPNRGKLTIINDDYEGTLGIEGKDWRRDKTAQISLLVQGMGDSTAEKPIDLISTLLNTGHTTALAWDGVALFGNHTWGKSGTIDNDLGTGDGLAGGATPTTAQMATNIFLAIQRLLSFKDDQGRPMNQRAKSFKLQVPVNMIQATESALKDMFSSAGVTNPLAGIVARGGFKISYEWNGSLTASDTFFLWRDDARVKPFIYQEEFVKPPYLLAEGSEHFKKTNKVEIGTHMACAAAPGKYELIVRGKTA